MVDLTRIEEQDSVRAMAHDSHAERFAADAVMPVATDAVHDRARRRRQIEMTRDLIATAASGPRTFRRHGPPSVRTLRAAGPP